VQISKENPTTRLRRLYIYGLLFSRKYTKNNSETKDVKYRAATPQEESEGIDGFIGEIPVSIKPITYKTMS
jgi:hypothetical protein